MKIKSLFIALTALFAVMMASCSKESPVLETIPADTQFVVKINGKKVIKALQIKADKETLTLPDYLKSYNIKPEKLELIAKIFNSVDAENMYIFGAETANSLDVVVTGAITDLPAFESLFTDVEKTGGFNVGTPEFTTDMSVVWNDSQFWVGNNGSADKRVEAVKAILKAAGEESIADVPAVTGAFAGDQFATMAMCPIPADKKAKTQSAWSLSKFTTKGNALEINAEFLYADGSAFTLEGLTDINTSVLQYLPKDVIYATAFGASDKIDWKSLFNSISNSNALGIAEKAQLSMVLPYLESLDGTVMIGGGLKPGVDFATVAANRFDINMWQFIFMLHMKQKTADDLIKGALSLAQQAGITPTKDANGLYSANYEGLDIYLGMVDGYLTLANYKPEPTSGSALAGKFSGHQSAASVEIPNFTFVNPDYTFGLSVNAEGSGNKGKTIVTLTNTDTDFFPTIINAIAGN